MIIYLTLILCLLISIVSIVAAVERGNQIQRLSNENNCLQIRLKSVKQDYVDLKVCLKIAEDKIKDLQDSDEMYVKGFVKF